MINLDFIGTNVNLYYKKSYRHRTLTGSILSIFLVIISLVIFIYLGIELIKKSKPISYLNIEKTPKPSLNASNFFYAISFTNMTLSPLPDIINKFEFIYRYVDGRISPPVIKNFDMVPCTETNAFKNNLYGFANFHRLEKGGYFCSPDNINYLIEENYEDSYYTFLSISVKQCNKTKRTCVSNEEFLKNLTDVTYMVDVIFLDNYVQLGNYENPIQPIFKSYQFPSTINTNLVKLLTFNSINVKTDNGILLENYKNEYSFQRDSVIDNSFYTTKIQSYAMIQTVLTGRLDIYNREYIKIQTVIANSSGLINLLLLVLSVINTFLAKYELTEQIFKELIDNYVKENNAESNQDQNYDKIPRLSENSEQIKTEQKTILMIKNNLPSFLPRLNIFQMILLNIPFIKSSNIISQEYDKMRNIIESSLDYVNLIKFYLRYNQLNLESSSIRKIDSNSSKSVRSEQIIIKSNNKIRLKKSSELSNN